MRITALWVLCAVFISGEVQALTLRDSLGMFESGANRPQRSSADAMLGGSGEVSRFQILPSVWRQYSRSRDYQNPEVAWSVAQKILDDRSRWFQRVTGREPDGLELYLLWNKPGDFAAARFNKQSVRSRYRKRAERFANLYSVPRARSGLLLATQ